MTLFFSLGKIKNPGDVESLQKEISLMRKLRHRHVLQLREVFEYPNEVVLVTELVPGGELFDKIVQIGAYSEGDAANAADPHVTSRSRPITAASSTWSAQCAIKRWIIVGTVINTVPPASTASTMARGEN